jgi:hypothetical protein
VRHAAAIGTASVGFIVQQFGAARSIAITPRRLADIADVLTESELADRRTAAAGGR